MTTYYFDSSHLLTKVEVVYTPTDASQASVATTLITRGCSCTIPTAIQDPDNSYTTFTVSNSDGNVTEVRKYLDDEPSYTQSAGSDLVQKAYYAAINLTYFGAVTKIVGPKAFTATPDENKYSTTITYDYSGNPITISYPATTNPTQSGHTETRTYNSYGQLLTVKYPESLETNYSYHSSGVETGYLKELKVKYSSSGWLVFTKNYSNFGALTKTTDPKGNVTTFVVDNEFLVKKVTLPTPFSYERELSYNGNRALVRSKLENRKGTGSRDGNNPWWQEENIFDDSSMLVTKRREISESGGTVTWQETKYLFDFDYDLSKVTDPNGNQTTYHLDERGLQTKLVYADGAETKSYFDVDGLLEKTATVFENSSGAVTKVTRIEYDVFDRRSKTFDGEVDSIDLVADNFKQRYYDLASMVTKVEEYAPDGPDAGTDPDLLRKTQSYFDELDRLWKSERGGVGSDPIDTTIYEYDVSSRLTLVKDDNLKLRTTQYDLASRVTKRIEPSLNGQSSGENYEVFEYDLNSNLTKLTSHEVNMLDYSSGAKDFVWEYAFDNLDRLTSSTYKGSDGATGPNPVESISTYDTRNLVITKSDVDGVATEHEYDGLGRRTKTTYNAHSTGPNPIVNTVAYDKAGNITSRKDDANNETAYAYDEQNRLTKITMANSPTNDFQDFAYNDLGLLKSRKYGTGSTTDLTLEYKYDLRGLLTTKTIAWTTTPSWYDYDSYKTTEETFSYDGAYRLLSANDNDAKVTLAWNSLDELVSEKLNINLRSGGADNWKGEKTTSFTWDDTGKRRTSVTYPISGKKFESDFDALDRVEKTKLDAATDKPMTQYWYRGPGSQVMRRDRAEDLNVTSSSKHFRVYNSFDALNRLTKIEHKLASYGSGPPPTESVLRTFDYSFGDGSSGRLFEIATHDISNSSGVVEEHEFGYDKLARLTADKWVHPNPDETYSFTHKPTQFYEKREKTVDMSTTTELTITEASGGSLQVASYQPAGQMSPTNCDYDTRGNLSLNGTTGYHYDSENRLVYIDGATDLWFRYDALGRRVAEYDGSSHTLFYYDGLHIAEETDSSLNLNRLCLFGVQIDEVLYAGDTDGSGNLTAHRWPLADHLGSVIAVYDNSATEKTAIDYTTVFGETTMSGAETDFPYGFTGRRRLAAAGLYDYRARAYEPKLGRFLQRDPIGGWHDPVNLGNPFGYVGNDPTNDIDPSGLSGYPNETDTRCRDGIYRSGFIDWLIGCTAEFDELCMTKCKDAGYDEGRCVSRIFNPICDCYKYGRGTDGWERLNPLEVIEEASDLVDLATLGGTAAVKKGVKKLARGIVEGGEELVEKGVGKSVEELGGGLGKVIDGIKGLKKGARLTKEQIDALSKNLDLVLKKSLPEKVKRGRGEDIINFLRNDPRWKNLDQIPGAAAKIQEALKAHGLKWP